MKHTTRIETCDETLDDTIEIEIVDSDGKVTRAFLFWDDGWTPSDCTEGGVRYHDGFALGDTDPEPDARRRTDRSGSTRVTAPGSHIPDRRRRRAASGKGGVTD